MRKPKKKTSIEEAREIAWQKINQRMEEILKRRRNGKEIPAKVLPPDPSGREDMKRTWEAGADMVLYQAEHCCKTKKEKLEYLNLALECLHSSPKYVLREHLDEIEKKKDAAEYLRNPKSFERNNRYFQVDDPAKIIQAEIDRLEGKSATPRKAQGINTNFLRPYDKDPDYPFNCADLRRQLNVDKDTFSNWKKKGKRIADMSRMREWQDKEYSSYGKHLLLKTDGRQCHKKWIVDFLRFTGEGKF